MKRFSLRIWLLFFCIGGLVLPMIVSAATPKNLYHKAEACSHKLSRNTQKQAYRDNWLRCINGYQAVYSKDPSGSWAAAGLYMSGELYQKLYKRSARVSDREEAIDIFKRIINRYPKSRYRPRAETAIQVIAREGASSQKKEIHESTQIARKKYNQAYGCYRKLLKSRKKQKYRDNWLKCIEGFHAVYRDDPSGSWASAGLYMTGQLYGGLYQRSFRAGDREQSHELYRQIIARYPGSSYRKKAETALEKTKDDIHKRKISKTPSPSVQKGTKVRKGAAGSPEKTWDLGNGSTVTGLRYWSNPSYTRIVIDADQEATYVHRLLKKDPSISKPQRLYIDIEKSRLGKDIEKIIPINDDLLSDARAGQHTADAVRVVVDIKSFKTYKIFSLNNPFRIVLDVWGKDAADVHKLKPAPGKRPLQKLAKGGKKLAPSAIAKQLALGVKRIVIDPGHGGKDYGAPGFLKGVHEKDIVLKVAKRLAKKIRKELGCEVILTRNTDRYLTLEERTAIANTQNADLFVSIHANAAKDRRAHGIMTFILNLATDDESILVAARENATSTKNISDLQTILSELMQNAKINESSRLATRVQYSISKHLKKHYSRIKDKGVKQAPFYVLLGAQMPSILIETSFISNSRECRRLTNSDYQEKMAEGILQGIQAYIRETNPTAFLKEKSGSDANQG